VEPMQHRGVDAVCRIAAVGLLLTSGTAHQTVFRQPV
jgi:hypothetical protein